MEGENMSNVLMRIRIFEAVLAIAVLFLVTAHVLSAEEAGVPTTYYSPELYNSIDKEKVTVEINEVLAQYQEKAEEIDAIQKSYAEDGHILADCLAKRVELTANLVEYIQSFLKSSEPDALLYALQGKRELAELLRYFDDMKSQREYVKNNVEEVLSIMDFGAVGDGDHNDAPAFAKALDVARESAGPVKIFVPKGRYLFGEHYKPQKTFAVDEDGWRTAKASFPKNVSSDLFGQHIPLQKNLQNVIVEGEEGSVLLGSDPGIGFFLFYKCEYLTIRNLTFDYENIPSTQGVIESVDENSITVQIDDGYPDLDCDYFLSAVSFTGITYDAQAKRQISEARDKWVDKVKSLGGKSYQITFKRSNAKTLLAGLAPKRKIVFMARNNKRYSAVLGNIDCRHLSFENLTVHRAPGNVFGGNRSYATSVINCRILPPDGLDQMLCCNADPCMTCEPIIGPYLKNNHFERAGDDFANTWAGAGQLEDISEDGMVLSLNAGLWKPGSTASIIDRANGTVKDLRTIVAVKQLPDWKTEISLDKPVSNVVSLAHVGGKKLSKAERYEFTMDSIAYNDKAKMKHPDLVEDMLTHASGTVISGNVFKYSRAGGIFSKVSNSIVENNTIQGCAWAGELIIMFAHHYTECHAAHCITVRNNKFIENGNGIAAYYTLYSGHAKGITPIRNIRIEGNLFKNTGSSYLSNCRDVTITGNRFESGEPLQLNLIKNVELKNNIFDLPQEEAITTTEDTEITVSEGNKFVE